MFRCLTCRDLKQPDCGKTFHTVRAHSSSTYELPMFPGIPTFQFAAQPKMLRVAKHNIDAGAVVNDEEFDERAIHPMVQRVFVYEKGGWLFLTGPIEEGWCANATNRFNILVGLLEKCSAKNSAHLMIREIESISQHAAEHGGLSKIYVSFTTHE